MADGIVDGQQRVAPPRLAPARDNGGWVGRPSLLRALELGSRVDRRLGTRAPESGKQPSLRASILELDLGVGFSSAWRAYAIYKLFRQYPEVANCQHLGVGHFGAIIGAAPQHQLSLMRRAEHEAWSRRRLSREIAALKDAPLAEVRAAS